VLEFTDNDVAASGTKVRPAWTQMLRHLDELTDIICWASDRLYRRPVDLELLIAQAEVGALSIHALHTGMLELGTPDGRAVARITAALNKAEVERLGERVARKKASLIAEGKPTGGHRVFGYSRSGLEVVPEEAEVIRRGVSAFLSGASISSIVRDWNGQGFRTVHGYKWTPSGFKRLVTNKRLVGLHPSSGKKAVWPAILRRPDWDQVQRILSQPERQKFAAKGDRYLLSGLATCGVCGGSLSGRPSGDARLYICKATGKVHLGISAEKLEAHVLEVAQSHQDAKPPVVVADPATLSEPVIAALEQVEAALEEWGRRVAIGDATEAEYRGARKALVEKQAALEAELEAAQPASLPTQWQELAEDLRLNTRVWLESLIETLVVQPAQHNGGRFDTSRIEVVFRR
jgi:DNA invertase Pin-like site-specific DNA recombinase